MQEQDFHSNSLPKNLFYDTWPERDERDGCMWDPLWGKKRLLYRCVWTVFAYRLCANPASTENVTFSDEVSLLLGAVMVKPFLSVRCLRGAEFSLVFFSFSSSWLQTSNPLIQLALPERQLLGYACRRGSASLVWIILTAYWYGVPSGWCCWRKGSNLVDPASSHMLVSKTKPCMCKYKRYTVKLRMAH